MTGAQYKNVIKWSVFQNPEIRENDPIKMIKTIFNNLGVAFPSAPYKLALSYIKGENYLGWRICSYDESRLYANKGIATIAANDERIIMICPDNIIGDLSSFPEFAVCSTDYIKTAGELSETDKKELTFLVYSHGYKHIIRGAR